MSTLTSTLRKVRLKSTLTSVICDGSTAASQSEVNAGTEAAKYVSPATLQGRVDTDGTLAANSDVKIPSQKAVKTYVDANAGSGVEATLAEALAGTGSTQLMSPRRVHQTAQRVYNVEAYGAVHDNSIDDTAAIQSAINACFAAGGGTVYFPNGIYKIAGALQTSISGVNPNCQIYIPVSTLAAGPHVTIQFVGESNYNILWGAYNNTDGVILKSTITGSGTAPAVFGSKGTTDTFYENLNLTNVIFRNISVQVYTNNGAAATTVTPFYFRWNATSSFYNCSAGPDVPLANTTSPVSSEVAGFVLGSYNDNGPNVVDQCNAGGFKYGFVLGEHTTVNNVYSLGNYYGFLFTGQNFGAVGVVLVHYCNTGFLFDNTGLMGTIAAGTPRAMIDLIVDYEIDTPGKWYDTSKFLVDSGDFGYGRIRYSGFPFPYNNLSSTTTGGTNLYISGMWSLPNTINQAGGPITSSTSTGANDAVYEVSTGPNAPVAQYDYGAIFQAVTKQPNTSTAAVGKFQVLNGSIGGAEKRMMCLGVYTNGATNTSIIYFWNLIAGVQQQVFTIDKGLNISIPMVLPQYASDAAADAASQAGSAPKGTVYYNTATDKLKIKENATWKTVTTS